MQEQNLSTTELRFTNFDKTTLLGASVRTKHLLSIDILRALAILLMIQTHFELYLSQLEPSTWPLWGISLFLGWLPAPTFSFLVGLSLYIWLESKRNGGWNEQEMTKSIVRRGLFLFLVGLGYLTFIWRPQQVFCWDILTFLGTASIILLMVRKWSVGRILAIALLVTIISPPLRILTDYQSHWNNDNYRVIYTLTDVVLGFLLHGYFPVLPWIVFPLIGFAVGKQLRSEEERRFFAGSGTRIMGFGSACSAAILHSIGHMTDRPLGGYFDPPRFYPANTIFLFSMVGILCLGFWILNKHLDNRANISPNRAISFFQKYSMFAFTTYLVHHMAFVWPAYIIGMCHGKKPHYYISNAVSPPVAILLAFLFIVVFYQVLKLWETKRKYSIEGLLRWLM